MSYLHPDKLVSVDRILTKKKARRSQALGVRRPPASVKRKYAASNNLVENLAAHIYAARQARG